MNFIFSNIAHWIMKVKEWFLTVLENVNRDRTVLIIAHKLNTIKSGDFIDKLQHDVIERYV